LSDPETGRVSSCPFRVPDRRWIESIAIKVNLKKYISVDGKWRFVPVLKVTGKTPA
jgi:hypothetical protein